MLAVELLFAGALVLWSLLRAYSPELTTAGGEKFMEIMYLNSIGRSEYFPPHDAWLSGYEWEGAARVGGATGTIDPTGGGNSVFAIDGEVLDLPF